MKQILQNLKNGRTELAEVPSPCVKLGHLLIQTTNSLVSVGTERMLIEFGKANLISKARQQPDKVRRVLDKIRTDGLLPTLKAVHSKLDQQIPLGYCNVGEVVDIGSSKGSDFQDFRVGDRVVCNGFHAEVVSVPKSSCVKIPDGVSNEDATFTVIGAIALQGIRLAGPMLGESYVVMGLGLIGLTAVQLLKANGCRVLGIDLDPVRLKLARQFGADTVDLSRGDDPVTAAHEFSRQRGVDGVLITASTRSSEPVHHAAQMCRKKGRIILVGVTGLELSRDDFYKKELSFQISCSYGPGRYDPSYEEEGRDYPIGYVRWTMQRNFEAVLDMISSGALDVQPLISHRYPIDRMEDAYTLLGSGQPHLGILLNYDNPLCHDCSRTATIRKHSIRLAKAKTVETIIHGRGVVGFIGAGNYAGSVLIPAFKKAGATLETIVSRGGVSAAHYGEKFGFSECSTDAAGIFHNDHVDTVVIATRHNTHAGFVSQALKAGKHVFVEKPLCLTMEELREIEKTYEMIARRSHAIPIAMVGFNRRFASQVRKIKTLLESIRAPKSFIMTVNAGIVPPDHWTQDIESGGGRIVGEACHFIDLLRFLAGASITGAQAFHTGGNQPRDRAALLLSFADGSTGTIHYLANGHRSFPKERLEVFCTGRVLQLDNFRKLRGYGWPGFRKMNLWRQDKGQFSCAAAFVDAVREGGAPPIPFDEIIEVSKVAIELTQIR